MAQDDILSDSQKKIGQLIRAARIEQRLSQQQLADKAGVTRITVSRYENTKWAIKFHFEQIMRIATALGLEPEAFYECLDIQGIGPKVKKREKLTKEVLKNLRDANAAITELQVAALVADNAAKALQRTKKAVEKLVQSLELSTHLPVDEEAKAATPAELDAQS